MTIDHENTIYPSLSFACPFLVSELNLLPSITELAAPQIHSPWRLLNNMQSTFLNVKATGGSST